ncbi:MAG: hypothetical protein JXA30_16675 [Deltaproteobacteria bacterium]|nr:hypothetical protein [Deltaproteobacteria bacterium]
MSLWKGPVRWTQEGSGAPAELRNALRSARAQFGTRDQLHRIAQRLETEIGTLNTSSIPAGVALLGNKTSTLSGLKVLLSVFSVAIVGTALLWQLPFESPTPAATPIRLSEEKKEAVPAVAIPILPSESKQEAADSVVSNNADETSPPAFIEEVKEESRLDHAVEAFEQTPQTTRNRPRQAPGARTKLDPEDELRILRRAQDDLVSRPLRALGGSERHLRDYPTGVFSQEREMIAIEALFQLNRLDQGIGRAKRFLERYGDSTHAPRVRSLLEEATGEGIIQGH